MKECRKYLVLIAILIVQLASYLPELSSDFRFNNLTGRDDAEAYIALGHSLANGRGYTRSLDSACYVPHKHYPPGFPLIISLGFTIGESLLFPQMMVMAIALVNTGLFWTLARDYLGWQASIVAVVMFVFSPIYDRLATHLMAEQATVCFLLLCVLVLKRWRDNGYQLDRWAILAVFGIAFGLIVRGLLLPVIPAVCLFAWFRNEWPLGRYARLTRTGALLGIAMIPWLVWTVRGIVVQAPGYDGVTELQDSEGPLATLAVFPSTAWQNIKWFFAVRIADAFAGSAWFLDTHIGVELPAWTRAALLAVLIVSCLRVWQVSQECRFVVLVLGFLVLLLLPRPSGGAPRYWVNLFPFILLIIIGAFKSIGRESSQPWFSKLSYALGIVLILAALGSLLYDHSRRQPQDNPAWDGFVRICRVARDCTPCDAVILSHNITAARFISQRYVAFTDADRLWLQGNQEKRHEVYAIVPSAAATENHGRHLSFDHLTTHSSEIARNEFYTIHRLLPEQR
jgi:hypothetical protein